MPHASSENPIAREQLIQLAAVAFRSAGVGDRNGPSATPWLAPRDQLERVDDDPRVRQLGADRLAVGAVRIDRGDLDRPSRALGKRAQERLMRGGGRRAPPPRAGDRDRTHRGQLDDAPRPATAAAAVAPRERSAGRRDRRRARARPDTSPSRIAGPLGVRGLVSLSDAAQERPTCKFRFRGNSARGWP